MGQGTVGVDPQHLESEIAALRDELGTLVGELDYRRHELFDVKLQLRRHAWQLALAGVGFSAAVAGVVAVSVWRARSRQGLIPKATRLREGLSRMIERPERVATERGFFGKLLTAAATALVATAATKTVEHLVRQLASWDSAPSARSREASDRSLRAA